MKFSYTNLVTLFLILIAVSCPSADLEKLQQCESHRHNNVNQKEGKRESGLESSKVDPIEKAEDQEGRLTDWVENVNSNKRNASEQLESQEAPNVQTNTHDRDPAVKEGDKKLKTGGGLKSKEALREGKLPPERKESFWVEECNPTNGCADEKKALVACLRVPGDESPDFLLLIQNKGKGPLSVTISAADFVLLEKRQLQLQEKEDQKVKVSIRSGEIGNFINLTGGNGYCSLDLRDLIAHKSKFGMVCCASPTSWGASWDDEEAP